MKRLYLTIAFSPIISLFFASCYYDNEEALYPSLNTSCDTTNVTYSITVVSILSNNCYSCHSNNNAAAWGNNIRLQNYSDVVAHADHISQAMKHTGSVPPMPQTGGKVNTCSITRFDIWVSNGLLNN